jgi:ABC-type transporter Mla subunit MlaD
MTSKSASRFKLGVLAVSVLAAITIVVLVLGLREKPTDVYHAYFEESVHGLERGAPVKLRGVPIGTVSGIAVAPDRERIDVSLAVDSKIAKRLDLATIAPRLRARLALQGVTGLKLVDIDVAAPDAPIPVLPFPPAERYIPSQRSILVILSENAEVITQDVRVAANRTAAAITTIERLARQLEEEGIPSRLGAALDSAHETIGELRRAVAGIDRARVPDRVAHTLAGLDTAISKAAALLERVGGVTDVVADVGRDTRGRAEDFARTLRELGDAARSIRRFFNALEREPDMLIKGRSQEARR